MVGHPDGKMSDDEMKSIADQYGPAAETYFNSFQTAAAKDAGTTRQTVRGPQASLMNTLLNVIPLGASSPMQPQAFVPQQRAPGDQTGMQPMDVLKAGWSALNPTGQPYPNMTQDPNAPKSPIDPNMLMNLMRVAQGMPGQQQQVNASQ